MKTATLLSIVLLAAAMVGCSESKTEKAEADEALRGFLNQNPSRRISSMEEAKNLDPNTGEPRAMKAQDEKK